MEDLQALFMQKYANLPFGARDEIVAVVDGSPFTWNSAKIEVGLNTEKGQKILAQLRDLGIL